MWSRTVYPTSAASVALTRSHVDCRPPPLLPAPQHEELDVLVGEDAGVNPETWVHRVWKLQKRSRLPESVGKDALRSIASRIACHSPERGDVVSSDAVVDFVTFAGIPGPCFIG